MVSVNNIQTQTFKGNYEYSSNGTPYYKTNSGIKVGGVMAGLGAIASAQQFYKKNYTRGAFSLALAAAHLGCGAIYDKIRNSNAQKAAEEVKVLGVKDALSQNERIEISRKRHAYYNSNDGLKYGALLGAGFGIAEGLINVLNKSQWEDICKSMEVNDIKPGKFGVFATTVALGAIGGLIMGKIADYFTNRDAFKNS